MRIQKVSSILQLKKSFFTKKDVKKTFTVFVM